VSGRHLRLDIWKLAEQFMFTPRVELGIERSDDPKHVHIPTR